MVEFETLTPDLKDVIHVEAKYDDIDARIFLHEYDHLIGKTWLDHITESKNIMANDVWMKKFL